MSRKIIFGLLIALAFVPDRLPGAAAPVKIQRIGYLTANSSAVPIQKTSWQMPVSNADIGMTLAHILGLQIQRKGVLVGRVLREALKSDGSTQPVKKFQRLSSPSIMVFRPFSICKWLGTLCTSTPPAFRPHVGVRAASEARTSRLSGDLLDL